MSRMSLVWALLNPSLEMLYSKVGEEERVAAVVAVPFNRYLAGSPPDRTNQQIADAIEKLASACRCDRFVGQWEHCSLLRYSFVVAPIDVGASSGQGEWVQTTKLCKEIASMVLSWERGNVVVVVGHPHHVRRVAILLEYYGLDPRVSLVSACVEYDHDRRTPGRQLWCSTPLLYIPWEYLSRIHISLMALLGRV